MNDEQVKKLKEYEALKIEEKRIANELNILKGEILNFFPTDQNVDTGDGVFSCRSKVSWEYSASTKELEEQVETVKKREQQDGTAIATKGDPYLVYSVKGSNK